MVPAVAGHVAGLCTPHDLGGHGVADHGQRRKPGPLRWAHSSVAGKCSMELSHAPRHQGWCSRVLEQALRRPGTLGTAASQINKQLARLALAGLLGYRSRAHAMAHQAARPTTRSRSRSRATPPSSTINFASFPLSTSLSGFKGKS